MTTEVMGFGESSATLVLALFGIGMTLGALAAGPLTDRALRPTLYGSLAALAVVLVAFRFTVHSSGPPWSRSWCSARSASSPPRRCRCWS